MTILNVHVDDRVKNKIRNLQDAGKFSSISDFVRKAILDKLDLEGIPEDNAPQDIPEYIPKNKYVAFVKGAVVAVGDSPSDVSLQATEKFPNEAFHIKYNGVIEKKSPEYFFSALLGGFQCWHYSTFNERSYPVVPIRVRAPVQEPVNEAGNDRGNDHGEGEPGESEANGKNNSAKSPTTGDVLLRGLVDTGATICVIKAGMVKPGQFPVETTEEVFTAGGIQHRDKYRAVAKILDLEIPIHFILAPIPDEMPFQCLIGRDLLDKLDAFLLGDRQVVCFRPAE